MWKITINNKATLLYNHIDTIFGFGVVESQCKSPLNDRRIITRRNFWNEQAPSAEVIYNDTQRSRADTTGNQTQR